MKRSILTVLTLLLLLLLTACQPVPGTDDGTASSIPVTTPPTASTPATNPPELDETGYSFIYDGAAPFVGIDADYSGCTVGHLYWVDKTSGEVTLILAETVLDSNAERAYVYYVKKAEPATLYRTPIGEFSQHELMYDCSYGPIKALPPVPEEAGYSLSTAGRLYWVDRTSGDLTVALEEPVLHHHAEGAYLYYVKKAEPMKIYRTPIWEFSQHELIYECSWQIKALPLERAEDGQVVIFYGPPSNPDHCPDWWPTEGLIDHLYWIVEATKERTLVCDEPVVAYEINDAYIFFVKKAEPTKVYATPIGNFDHCELIYESSYGDISDMRISSAANNLLQFVADEKKFVVYDMATGESTLLMEQYYINFAYMLLNDDGTWGDIIVFEGQHTEDDGIHTMYTYNRVTGELWEDK